MPNDEPILDRIRSARDKARQDGRRVTLEIPKAKFLEEIPTVASDPRITMFGDTVYLNFDVNEELSVKELRKICRDSQSPLAKQKLLSVLGLPDTMSVVVLKQDLIEMREGKSSIVLASANVDPVQAAEPDQPVGLTHVPPSSQKISEAAPKKS